MEKIFKLHQKLYSTLPFQKRRDLYQKHKPLLNRLEKPFKKMILARNRLVNEKGYPNFVEFVKEDDNIPEEEYHFFIAKVDQVIGLCNRHLSKIKRLPSWFYSRYNPLCLLCQVSFPSLSIPTGVVKLIEKLYPQLKLFSGKINISYGKIARTRYIKESDTFEVTLRDNVNTRHQTIDLIHELGHVVDIIDNFSREIDPFIKGKYVAEKKAFKILLESLLTISEDAFKAYLADLLLEIQKVLFEINIYKKPNQDYAKLNAWLFNHCFLKNRQRRNPLYLIDEQIITRPLSSLLYSVAATQVLLDFITLENTYKPKYIIEKKG